jgi:serine/threonine protein kinase
MVLAVQYEVVLGWNADQGKRMPTRITCSHCGKNVQVRDKLAGKQTKCPYCGAVFLASKSAAANPLSAAPLVDPVHVPDDDEQLDITPKIIGGYEILGKVGKGGAATVYKARPVGGGAIVALKQGHRELAMNPAARERFKREFTGLRDLRHPSLVRPLDFGESDDVPYLILEFVPGQTLEQRLKERGPLPQAEAIQVFRQVAEGLRYLHEHHILHRDIKPANILLGDQGEVKLADFGLLKDLAADTITRSRQGMGTMEYGAPEQFENAKETDFRCDIYSLAAALYTALTGQFPFGLGGHLKVLQRKLQSRFVPLGRLAPQTPPELDELIRRSLQAERSRRPDNIQQFVESLSAIAKQIPQHKADAGSGKDGGVSSGGRERRVDVRTPGTLPAAFVPFHQSKRGLWNATVLDFSSGGFRLHVPEPYPPGTVLEVMPRGSTVGSLVQVRWAHTAADQTHTLGCAFVQPLTDQELKAIAAALEVSASPSSSGGAITS